MIAVAIIVNGISRKKNKFYSKIYPALVEKFSVEIFETKWAGHARELGREAAALGVDVILVAGGDGTLNQVVNGIFEAEVETWPAVGLIPLGTGNDFARTCQLKLDANQITRLLEERRFIPTDIGKLVCHDDRNVLTSRFFVNACSLGIGPEVVRRLVQSSRRWGPSFTYLAAIFATFIRQQPVAVSCETPGWRWNGKARVLAVANGCSFGHALYIAPDAKPDDGRLNTFIAGEIALGKFLLYLQAIKNRVKVHDRQVVYNQVTSVTLHSSDRCPVEVDGELAGFLPAVIEVMPARLKFLR